MTGVEIVFIAACALAGAGLGLAVSNMMEALTHRAERPAHRGPRTHDTLQEPAIRVPKPLAPPPMAPLIPPQIQEALSRLLEMQEDRQTTESQLLAEIRGIVSAQDPEITKRLDRIEAQLNTLVGLDAEATEDITDKDTEAELAAEDPVPEDDSFMDEDDRLIRMPERGGIQMA